MVGKFGDDPDSHERRRLPLGEADPWTKSREGGGVHFSDGRVSLELNNSFDRAKAMVAFVDLAFPLPVSSLPV